MNIESSLIAAYLNDTPYADTPIFEYVKETFHEPDKKRKDVVQELLSQLEDIVDEFPVFNASLWNSLFHNDLDILQNILIIPVVGTSNNQVLQRNDQYYIFIDLIHIANFTRIVSQMVYILQNYLTLEITKILIHIKYPLTSRKYIAILDYMTFSNGLANWLAWNYNCQLYKFQDARYEPHKEKAFGMLAQAIEVESKAVQHNILTTIMQADFWNQFTTVAGLFYFDDIYHDLGKDGIQLLYQHGPTNFIHIIFTKE